MTASRASPNVESSTPARCGLLLLNPHSRRAADADLSEFLSALEAGGIELRRRESGGAAENARLVGEQAAELDLVVVAGGDGTVNSVLASLHHHRLPLLVLPLGTANDLARSLDLPDELPALAQLVLRDQRRRIDLATLNGRYFVNAVNLGLGTRITRELSQQEKRRWGPLSYLPALWQSLSHKNSHRLRVRVDGRHYRLRSMHLTVGNGRFYGGGNRVESEASLESGQLCLYSLRPQSFWRLLLLAPLVRLGRQRLSPRTFTARGRRVEIRGHRPLELDGDGEPLGHTPAVLESLPAALDVYAPRDRPLFEQMREALP